MSDPRAENCRGFATDGQGRVIGVELQVDVRPEARYRLVRVELLDEVAAQGNTVATCVVLDRDGLQVGQPVSLAWPWPGLGSFALPGNPDNRHMITNGYAPPSLGPLALCIRDNGVIVSDVVGGLGLPNNRHISFRATWLERDPDADDDGSDDDDTPDVDPDDYVIDLLESGVAALERLAAAEERKASTLEHLAAHFGVSSA